MGTRPTLFQTPTVEVDQHRYEELLRNELKYEQYKACADTQIKNIIESAEINDENEREEK